MEQTTNKKMDFKTLAGIITGVVAMVLVQQFFFKAPSFDKQMMLASELNKTCPVMVDAETRLDNTVSLPDKILIYNYTLINQVKDSLNVEELKNYLTPLVTNNIKTNPVMKFYRDNKITLSYYYKDKRGVFLLNIDVTPDKYQ